MSLNGLDIFTMAKSRMDWLAQRQKVLAQNVANANTPDYRPQDLREGSFRDMIRPSAAALKPTQTNAAHMPGTIPDRGPYRIERTARPYEGSPDGNRVILEEQMDKIGSTEGEYTLNANLFQKYTAMIRRALGGQAE